MSQQQGGQEGELPRSHGREKLEIENAGACGKTPAASPAAPDPRRNAWLVGHRRDDIGTAIIFMLGYTATPHPTIRPARDHAVAGATPPRLHFAVPVCPV